MEQWTAPDAGVTKISNPKTLQRWIDFGRYKEMTNDGYIFNPYCGRFSFEKCVCSKCRSKRENKDELIDILNKCKDEI